MFQFVTVSHPDEIKDRKRQKKLREHAIRAGIQRSKAQRAKEAGNLVVCDGKDGEQQNVEQGDATLALTKTPSISLFDPFDTLTGNLQRRHDSAQQPTSKMSDRAALHRTNNPHMQSQDILKIFKPALSEPALFHALSLIHALSKNNPLPRIEVLAHRGHLLTGIRMNVKNQDSSTPKVSTFVAMLILISYEYRIDGANSESIATHISAVQAMMKICKERNIVLVEQVQRALFWQDLLSCLMSGTDRMMGHDDLIEFKIKRRADWQDKYHVPRGLTTISTDWSKNFLTLLEDLNALCLHIDELCGPHTAPIDILAIEDYQANLESRIVDCISAFRKSSISGDPLQEACMYATYMCIYKLHIGVWLGCYIPEVCVSQIFRCVTLLLQDSRIHEYRHICFWLLCFAGMMTTRQTAKQRLCGLIHDISDLTSDNKPRDWTDVRGIMRQLIWCNYACGEPMMEFWNYFLSTPRQASHRPRTKKLLAITQGGKTAQRGACIER